MVSAYQSKYSKSQFFNICSYLISMLCWFSFPFNGATLCHHSCHCYFIGTWPFREWRIGIYQTASSKDPDCYCPPCSVIRVPGKLPQMWLHYLWLSMRKQWPSESSNFIWLQRPEFSAKSEQELQVVNMHDDIHMWLTFWFQVGMLGLVLC